MIDAKELKTGNLVMIDKMHRKVESVCINPVEVYVEGIDYNYALYTEPIPLTEELFTEKGYESNTKQWKGNGHDWQPDTSKTRQIIFIIENETKLIFEYFSYRANIEDNWITDRTVKIEFCHDEIFLYKYELHVLQNLIHSLTGKELTIKA